MSALKKLRALRARKKMAEEAAEGGLVVASASSESESTPPSSSAWQQAIDSGGDVTAERKQEATDASDVEEEADERAVADDVAVPEKKQAQPQQKKKRRKRNKADVKVQELPSNEIAVNDSDGEDLDDILADFAAMDEQTGADVSMFATEGSSTISGSNDVTNKWMECDRSHFLPGREIQARYGGDVKMEGQASSFASFGSKGGGKGGGKGDSRLVLVEGSSAQQVRQHVNRHNIQSGGGGTRARLFTIHVAYKDATGATCFSLRPTEDYSRVKQAFRDVVVNSHSVQNLMWFVQQYPYHFGGLLQASQLFESQSRYDDVHSLVQQGLLSLQQGWPSAFYLDGRSRFVPRPVGRQGNNNSTRADAEVDSWTAEGKASDAKQSSESKSKKKTPERDAHWEIATDVLLLLARQVQLLGKNGLPRTALEFLKLSCLLVPEVYDNAGLSFFFLDYYALRCQLYTWMLGVAVDMRVTLSTSISSSSSSSSSSDTVPSHWFPHLCYSGLVAAFHRATDAKSSAGLEMPKERMRLRAEDEKERLADFGAFNYNAVCLLERAVVVWPEVMLSILNLKHFQDQCKNNTHWSSIILPALLHHAGALMSMDQEAVHRGWMEKLTTVYTLRMAAIWENKPALLGFLRAQLKEIAGKLTSGAFDLSEAVEIRSRMCPASASTPATLRGLEKSSYTNEVPELPEALINQHPQQQHAQQMLPQGMEALDLNENPLMIFLRSMLPYMTVDPNAAP
jgi:hypothetical protein